MGTSRQSALADVVVTLDAGPSIPSSRPLPETATPGCTKLIGGEDTSIVCMLRRELFASEGDFQVHGPDLMPEATQNSWVRFHLFRAYNIQQILVVRCATVEKSAKAGKHFVFRRGEVRFDEGCGLAYFDVEVLNDEQFDAIRDFYVEIESVITGRHHPFCIIHATCT